MSVRVVARIRPLLEKELEKDIIVHATSNSGGEDTSNKSDNTVKIPNPKNEAEEFSFAFNGVYDQATTQEALFSAEGNDSLPASLPAPLLHLLRWRYIPSPNLPKQSWRVRKQQQQLTVIFGLLVCLSAGWMLTMQLNSEPSPQVPLSRTRRNNLCIWRNGYRQDAHDARRAEAGGSRCDPAAAFRCLPSG